MCRKKTKKNPPKRVVESLVVQLQPVTLQATVIRRPS